MSFQDDIKGQNTQLYPIVVIEKGGLESMSNFQPDYIFLSTNNSNINILHESVLFLTPNPTRHCKPLLLNIPSIKESVDIESRKFKISNVSLDISNVEYEGKRFSDILSETSLINTPVSIYFKSPSTTWVTSGNVIDDYLDTLCPMVYQGIIRRISHDDSKVKIELEDLTEKLAHKDLPQSFVPDLQPLPENKRGKIIPIVYGEVDRSPVVLSLYDETDLESEYSIEVDSKDISGYVGDNPLLINESDIYINILMQAKTPNSTTTSFGYSDPLQYEVISNQIIFNVKPSEYYEDEYTGSPLSEGFLVGSQIERPLRVEALQFQSDFEYFGHYNFRQVYYSYIHSPLSENNGFHIKGVVVRAGSEFTNYWDGSAPSDGVDGMWGSFEYGAYEVTSAGFNGEMGLVGCYISMPKFIDFDIQQAFILSSFWVSFYDREYLHHDGESCEGTVRFGGALHGDNAFYEAYDNQTAAGTSVAPNGLPNTGSTHNSLTGNDFPLEVEEPNKLHFYMGFSSGSVSVAVGQVEFFDHIEVHNQSLVKDFITKDYYANVKGRINTLDNHPQLYNWLAIWTLEELLIQMELLLPDEDDNIYDTWGVTISTIYSYLSLPEAFPVGGEQYIALVNLAQELLSDNTEGDFIQNPIDIIYDLVRSELGHHAIDELEYAEAKEAHADWKFGFTVDKKINSKKLIEDIAKSTKCFPKFKNDGTFGFNTIKDSYDVDNDYVGATPIKESEVISYSFKKTKPEQIYKNVTVSYNKDYAQDSYLKTTDIEGLSPYDLGDDTYYGVEDSSDAHLEFESDYIRNKDTAHDLALFLSKQYKNDHLIFNLKLPLQYIGLEIGDLVKFRDLFQGVKAYGIDYRIVQNPNDQWYYPLFMVISTTKNLNSVSIECMQLHSLTTGVEGSISLNTGFFDDIVHDDGSEGLFYFPDATPVIEQPSEEDEVILPEDADEVVIPSGHYNVIASPDVWSAYDRADIVFYKDNAVLLFDYTLYTMLDVGKLIKFQHENSFYYYEILGVYAGLLEDALRVEPKFMHNPAEGTFIEIYGSHPNSIPLDELLYGEGGSSEQNLDEDLLIGGASWQEPYPLGDANLDGGVDILDLVAITNHVMNMGQGEMGLTGQAAINADVNEDGLIDILDIVTLAQNILGD